MRNQFSGTCYRCGETVAVGAGHFERNYTGSGPRWRTQHADCAIKFRGVQTEDHKIEEQKRHAARIRRWEERAAGTGKGANRARKALRELTAIGDETP
jgi:hypothetical protein